MTEDSSNLFLFQCTLFLLVIIYFICKEQSESINIISENLNNIKLDFLNSQSDKVEKAASDHSNDSTMKIHEPLESNSIETKNKNYHNNYASKTHLNSLTLVSELQNTIIDRLYFIL